MTVIIAGAPDSAPTLAAGLETGGETAIWSDPGDSGQDSVVALARALVRFEADARARAIAAIVLADDSDAALAAALVGAKLPVDVFAVAPAREAPSPNGQLIRQLASAYTAPA
jgi:hypothetical protein